MIIGVKSLPKGALVEAQVVCHSGQYISADEEGYELAMRGTRVFDRGDAFSPAVSSGNHTQLSSLQVNLKRSLSRFIGRYPS